MGNRAVYVYKKTMEDKGIKEIQKKVTVLLDKARLKEAIDTLANDIESLQDWELRTQFTEIATAYKYLLEYLRQGMPDPDRERLHGELISKCYILNDLIAVTRIAEEPKTLYGQMRRRYKNSDTTESTIQRLKENYGNTEITKSLPDNECQKVRAELSKEHEQIIGELFNIIWSSCAWNKNYATTIADLLNSDEISLGDRATLTSALMLSTLNCFEPLKLTTLCTIAASHETTLSTRAIIGIVIVLFNYEERVRHYPELQQAIAQLQANNTIRHRIETIQIQLLRSRETQKIDRKMREEIIPAMMKNKGAINEKFSIDILKEIEEDEDKNPEWSKWIEQDLKDKLDEMAKWQIEGADLYMSTFSQLKNYPFFNDIVNWFRPFDPTIPQVSEVVPMSGLDKKSILGAICSSPVFCNSDKYSFCFTVKQVPQEQREMLMSQLAEGGDMTAQDADTFAHIPAEKQAEIESNQYIQDLYRFFKVSKFRNEFNDPFNMSLNLLESKELKPLINSKEATLRTFRYLVEKEYYSEAFAAGKIYESYGKGDAQFYQEMGYCLQKDRQFEAAVDYYTKADIIKPDTLWTLRHIAQCYRIQGEFDKAVSYYQMAEELAPDNISLLLQTGESFAALKQYEEAFARFYKVEYLKPDSLRATRAIAWCSFLTGKDEQARGYYQRLIGQSTATFEDYLNAAHVEWVCHNNATAVELYTKAKEKSDKKSAVAEQIMRDKEALTSRGVSENELLLLRDLIIS